MLTLLHQVAQALALLAAAQLQPACPTQVYFHADAWEDGSLLAVAFCDNATESTGWEFPLVAYQRDAETGTITAEYTTAPDLWEMFDWAAYTQPVFHFGPDRE